MIAAVSPQIPKTGIEPLPLRLKLPSRFAAESHWASDHHPNCLRNETIMTTTKKVETDDKNLGLHFLVHTSGRITPNVKSQARSQNN